MPHHHRLPPKTTTNARNLRRNATHPEQVLWYALRNRQVAGYKFRRQHPIGSYVIDFCCLEANLVIELDGRSHEGREEEDAARQSMIETLGFRVLRIANDDVLDNLEGVVEVIAKSLGAGDGSPSPSPSLKGRGIKRPR
ncbi:hypothetical protein Pla108_29080 [Botrimarina colliarenosi]|uniref:DUF559 domain-containing protein n=1 Tax=Botrimarina colliarenosi TaxID=2528001 RepID=A0A5C6A9W7_9BACT|nr:DUF559 domain-containing protein [Botrimarina colliarenosi]TWT95831.1 hypothetical protein Pla108_29080 [Botrimarina colliarenosi]